MTLLRLSLRELTQRPVRATLTVLGIVIAVAAVVSISIATKTTRAAHEQMFSAVTGRADLEVVAQGGGSFPIGVASKLDQLAGVNAVPTIRRFTIVYLPGKKARVQALGIDPQRDGLVRDYKLIAGSGVGRGTGVVLDANFAQGLRVKVGDQLKMLTRSGLRKSQVAGIVEPRSGSDVAYGGMLYMSIGLAQSRFRTRGCIDIAQLVLDEGVDVDAIQASIAAELPVGLAVRQPSLRSQLAEESMLSTEQGLQLATAFALMTAAFIVFNTFQMVVGERRGQFGILRAIGATRCQVALLILREGLLIGLIGTLFGSVAGLLGAQILTRGMEQLLQATMPPIQLTMYPFLLGIVFGVGLPLVATLLPASRAGRLSPSEAMRVVAPGEIETPRKTAVLIGLAIILGSAIALALCFFGWLPVDLSVVSSAMLLVGMVFLLPALLNRISKACELALRPIFGVEGELARRQLIRHRGRTALTIGMLFVAMATGVGMANTIVDNVRDVKLWYRQAIVGDFFVRALMPDMATGEAADMPDGLDASIRQIPGVKDLNSIRFVNANSGEHSIVVVIREFKKEGPIIFDLVKGEEREVLSGLPEGEIVISSVLAQRTGKGLGDSLPLETREGTRSLPIAGIANDYIAGGMTIYMHSAVAEGLLGVSGVDAYIVHADYERLPNVQAMLQSLCDEHGLLLQSYADLVGLIEKMMNGVVGGLWALLALGSLIATFGLVNTLTMNILEQTREIGMLRVVAMTRRQVRRTILAQAVMMGLIGLVPGTVMGVLIAYLINLSTLSTTGHAIQFVFRPWLLLACFTLAFVVLVVSAFLPADRAARLKLREAMQYE